MLSFTAMQTGFRNFVYTFLLLSSSLCMAQAEEWWKNTNIYQIYPRSYMDTNGDGIGDLNGIIQQLDYIKELGFETIWISPFYESPQGDFGYDISDYLQCDKDYGNNKDIEQLINAVHERDMKIVFDMVLNHTSEEHEWFELSKQSRNNDKSDWYIWRDAKGKKPPNNWINVFNKKAWHYVPERDQYYYTAFLDFQPDLNWRNPEVKEAMFDIVRYWLSKGVDGFRLDIFNCILEEKDLKNNPFTLNPLPARDGMRANFQEKTNNIDHGDNITLAKELRAVIDEFPDKFLIGEAIGSLESTKKLLGEEQDGLNLVFQFDMIFFDFNAEFFGKMIEEFEVNFPAPLMPTIVFGNHDNFRSMRRIGNNLNKAKLLALFQMTARGVPVVYYGEEIGMTNTSIPKSKALDPISDEFKNMPQFMRDLLPVPINRDVCRTPMQWNTDINSGFTKAANSWLPIEDFRYRNVATEMKDENSLLNVYRSLLEIRNNNQIFQEGTIELIDSDLLPENVLAYKRQSGNESFVIFINYNELAVSFPFKTEAQKLYSIATEDTFIGNEVNLSGLGGMILTLP